MSKQKKQRLLALMVTLMLVITTVFTPNGFFGVNDVQAAGHEPVVYNVDPDGPNGFVYNITQYKTVGTTLYGLAKVTDSVTTTGKKITEGNQLNVGHSLAGETFDHCTIVAVDGVFAGLTLTENNCIDPGYDCPFIGMEKGYKVPGTDAAAVKNGGFNYPYPYIGYDPGVDYYIPDGSGGTKAIQRNSKDWAFGYKAVLVEQQGDYYKWQFTTNYAYGDGKYGNNLSSHGLTIQRVSEYIEYGFKDIYEFNVTVKKESSSVKLPFDGINFDIYDGTTKICNMKVDGTTGTVNSKSLITGLASGYEAVSKNGIWYVHWRSDKSKATVTAKEKLGGNKNYKLNSDVTKTIEDKGSGVFETLKQTNDTTVRNVYVIKSSANNGISNGNSCYDLTGAQFGVYLSNDDAKNKTGSVATLTVSKQSDGTYATGKADLTAYFAAGVYTFYIRETKAPKGFRISNEIKSVTFTDTDAENQMTKSVSFKDEPVGDPVLVNIEKECDEGNAPYSLEGTIFEIDYYDTVVDSRSNLSGNPKRKWYVKTVKNDVGKYIARLQGDSSFISDSFSIGGKNYTSDERYTDSRGNVIVPIGSITIRELVAAEGYIKDSGTVKVTETGMVFSDRIAFFTIRENDSEGGAGIYGIDVSNKSITVTNSAERGDLSFTKVDTKNKKLANVTFNLSLMDETGKKKVEAHQIKTDAEGNFDSKKSDVYFYGTSDKTKWDPSKIDSSKGHLVLGTYRLEEVKTDANEGLQLIEPKTFKVTSDGQVVNQGTLIDTPNPEIKTLEWDKDNSDADSNTHISMADSEVTVIDTVTYTNLISGNEYTVKGILVNTKGVPIKDKDGSFVVAHKTFTAADAKNKQQSCGTVDVTFTFNAEKLAGSKFVIFEYLYSGTDDTDVTVNDNVIDESNVAKDSDGVLIKHTDTADESQIGFFPSLSTQAKVEGTDEQYAKAGETVNIIDTVKYTNLIPGEEFTISGKIVDSSTGKVIQSEGKNVTATKTFKPDKANGSVEMMFTVNMTGFEGKTLAVYENVTYKKYGTVVAKHTNPKDVKQQIHIPDMGTKASDNETGNNLSYADGRVVINDVISYSNLEPGKTYAVNGKLVEKITNADGTVSEGEVIKDAKGNEVTTGDTFVASDTGNGTVTVRFEFDAADDLAGKTAVAFEEILGYAAHADINDKPQTIKFPKIGTTAKDVKTMSQIAEASENVELVDTIAYENLNAGESYIVFGQLMDKNSGEPVLDADGKEITATIENFVPEKDKGTVDMTFSFDGSILGGRTTVVFERISKMAGGKEVTIAQHTDLTSAKQTIAFPGGHTTALGSETGNHHVAAGEDVTVIDTVYYSNLLPDTTYTLEGRLMLKPEKEDREEADKIATSGDAEPLDETDDQDDVPKELMSKTITFTTGSAHEGEMFVSGSVDMSFTFDASLLEGRTVVAFETVKQEGVTVFTHADIDDEDQTVFIPKIRTTVKDAVTGDHISAGNRMIKVIDTVEYENLLPSTEYVITGKLMDKETGEAFLDSDGKEVISVLTFTTPDTSEDGQSVRGSVDMEFEFNAEGITGKEVVVFESLYSEDVEVAVHADIEDKGQTFYIPGGHTEAKNGKTGTHTAKAEKEVTIIDTVYYEKLLPNKEYTVKGILMDKGTGEPLLVDGKEVVAETTFVTETEDESGEPVNGSIEMKFSFDASALEGKSVVVFETVYKDDKEVFVHADIEDEDQTVSFPSISTTADIDNGRKRAEEAKNLVIRDMVEYDNLTPGEKYTVKGVLMDPKTGSPLLINGKSVTAEAEFIPESKNGCVEVSFTFDGTDLLEPGQSMKVVVFETLYAENGEELAKHTEIDDEKQTVEIYNPKKPPKTGDGFSMILIIVIGVSAAFVLAAALKRRKDS